MVAAGIKPFPMVFDCRATDKPRYKGLKRFQRWAVTGLYRYTTFAEYDPTGRGRDLTNYDQMEMET